MEHRAKVDGPFQHTMDEQLSRRGVLKRAVGLGLSAPAITTLLTACGGGDGDGAEPTPGGDGETGSSSGGEGQTAGEGVRGGTLRVGMIGEPPTLDIHQTTATIVAMVTWNIYEALFTYDEDFQLTPMLAESHEVSGDGLTNTVKLRQGVKFHNGDEMKAADVIASVLRWGSISGLGQSLIESSEEIKEVDDYTVEFHMTEPFGTFAPALAHNNQGCGIYPQSVIDKTGDGQLQEFIGTAPYKFVERQADRFIRLARFDDYTAREGEPSGYGGHKYQYLDEIMFIPVPDEAARIAGLQAGDYDYLESVSPDQHDALAQDPNLDVEKLPPGGWETFVLNWKSPLMGNQKIRQAFQAALNHEPILQAGQGDGFYRLDPGVMLKETAWHNTAAEELYNRNDPETAKKLLQEAGYDGTAIRFMTTKEYQDMYNQAVVGKQQLEAAGFTVQLETVDWATLVDRRSDPELWDAFTTGISFKPDPTQLSIMQLCSWPGWWCSDESMELLSQLQHESDVEARKGMFQKLQENFYNEVPMIKIGDSIGINAKRKKVKGFVPQTQLGITFWNMWIEE